MTRRRLSWPACLLQGMLVVICTFAPARADDASQPGSPGRTIGRPVRVVSIAFSHQKLEEVVSTVEREGKKGADVILLPEVWHGDKPEPIDGPAVTAMAALARKHKTYIVCPIDRGDGKQRFNSAVLLDRKGQVAYTYDKLFPTTLELREKPPRQPGSDTKVYQADFGRLGLTICFDVSFPEVWRRLSDQGAELVLWASAYSAGSSLQAHALNHNFYIVTSTLVCDCTVVDITGEIRLYESKPGGINVSRVTLDLDREIYSSDFNMEKRDKLLKEHADDVVLEKWAPRESWFVLRARRPGVSARKLAAEYGLEELRPYLARSRREADQLRGWEFLGKPPAHSTMVSGRPQ
jgi:predicted amidohydrolase